MRPIAQGPVSGLQPIQYRVAPWLRSGRASGYAPARQELLAHLRALAALALCTPEGLRQFVVTRALRVAEVGSQPESAGQARFGEPYDIAVTVQLSGDIAGLRAGGALSATTSCTGEPDIDSRSPDRCNGIGYWPQNGSTQLGALVPPQFSETAALAWILTLRFLGGIFLGGGYTSAVPLAMEWTAPRRRGLVSGLIMGMSPWANATIAALTFVLLASLGAGGYSSWGWRPPFLIGAGMAVTMLVFYHRYVSDVPIAAEAPSASTIRESALHQILLGRHARRLAQVAVLMSGLWLFTDMAIPVFAGQLVGIGHLSAQTMSFAMLCGTAASALAMVACGHLSTRTGRRSFYLAFGTLSMVAAPVVYLLALHRQPLFVTVSWVVALQLVTVSAYGPIAAYLTELFPTGVRASGYGVAYSVSIVLPALYPYYLPPLQHALGQRTAVAGLLGLAGLLVAVGAALGPATDANRHLAT